jgi:hypothetical protein
MTVYTKEMKNESNLRQSNVLNNIQECAVSWQHNINKIKCDGVNIMIL